MSARRLSLALLALLGTASAAAGQPRPEPPKGPRDVITGAQQARAKRELQGATTRGPEPAPAPSEQPGPAPSTPRAHHGAAAPPPEIASARPAPELPKGTIEVRVIEASGAPAAAAEVSLGIMHSDGTRSSKDARADAAGTLRFEGLAFGDRQAYRVNVPYRGAKYSSMPFRLPHDGGYAVQVRRLPVTRDDRMVVLYLGATSVELKDDRIKVVQQSRLTNLGHETYVFPEQGTLVRFPAGFLAVQTEDVMTDQRVTESKGEGVRVRGSLPPGEATLLWGFDLPLDATEASFTIGLPWIVFAYRVISDAPPGMKLEVYDMPEPVLHEDTGRRLLVTEMQRKVGESPFSTLRVTLRGIPGPGPLRWIAAAIALFALGLGAFVALGRVTAPAGAAQRGGFDAHEAELLTRLRRLDAEREQGEIGPEYHAEQVARLTDQLAELLRAAERAREAAGSQGGSGA